jgi:hypothetical protein
MPDVDPPEGQIGLDQRPQHFQIGIILEIWQIHSDRVVRIRTIIKREAGSLVVLLLAERAP